MKRSKIVVACLIVVFMFLSCSSKPSDYYPLKKELVWTYRIDNAEIIKIVEIFPPRKLDKKKVIPQKIEVNGQTTFTFLVENNKGISKYAQQAMGAVEPSILPEPDYILKNPLRAGTSWEKEIKTTVIMEEATCPIIYTIEKEKETVTVPAGTYEKCIKVKGKGSVEIDKGLLGVITVTITHYDWYAPNVGLIKSVKTESGNHMLTPVKESIVQLQSFKK